MLALFRQNSAVQLSPMEIDLIFEKDIEEK